MRDAKGKLLEENQAPSSGDIFLTQPFDSQDFGVNRTAGRHRRSGRKRVKAFYVSRGLLHNYLYHSETRKESKFSAEEPDRYRDTNMQKKFSLSTALLLPLPGN